VDPPVPAADLEIGHSGAMMDSALTNGTQVAWTTGESWRHGGSGDGVGSVLGKKVREDGLCSSFPFVLFLFLGF
jgi:hypothetical protein